MKQFKVPQRYLPKSLTNKDRKNQASMLLKSRKMYKKKIYYTRKRLPSFKQKESKHLIKARKIYKITNITPNAELSKKTGCSISALKKIVNKILHFLY